MKWVEIITLRSPGNINRHFVDELLKGVTSDSPRHLEEIKIYHHSVVETDLSIHLYWKSEKESHDKSPLGLRFSSALKPLGLLNHNVWVEAAVREFVARNKESSKPRDLPGGNYDAVQPRIGDKEEA
ncbi:MAG TPA: hypothetical protein VKF36_14095 [Syntrophorhabdales bacterium]|nr:hypothetical protein [Syntrophorhabdales bacterium]